MLTSKFSLKLSTMRFISLFVLSIVLYCSSFSQVSTIWSENTPGNGEGRIVILDNADNIYFIDDRGGILKMTPLGDTLWFRPNLYYSFSPAKAMFDNNQDLLLLGTYKVNTAGDKNMLILKMDTSGTETWNLSIDTQTGNREAARAMDIDQNNNIYITGYDGGQFFGMNYTAKVSSNGSLVWESTDTPPYSGAGNDNTGVDIIVKDSNNIYIVGNESRNGNTIDATIIKRNSSGTKVWKDVFSWNIWQGQFNQSMDYAKKIALDDLGNVYALTYFYGGYHGIVLKYSPSGNRTWVKQIESSVWTEYHELIVDATGVYVSGYMTFLTSTDDKHLTAAKLDFNGNVIWSNHALSEICNGGYMDRQDDGVTVTGTTQTCNGCDNNIYTVHYDSTGNIIWTHTENTQNGWLSDEAFDIAVDQYNGIYITGHGFGSSHIGYNYKIFSCSDIDTIISIQPSNLVIDFIYNATYQWIDCSNDSIVYVTSGNTYSPPYLGSFKVKTNIGSCSKISNCVSSATLGIETGEDLSFQVYPNPNRGNFNIKLRDNKENISLKMIDISGKVVFSQKYVNVSNMNVNFNFSSGIYYIELTSKNNSYYQKIIIQ